MFTGNLRIQTVTNSDHPPHVKRGVIKSLLNRARDISAQSTLGLFLAFFDFVFCYLFSPEDGSNMAVKTCWLFQFFVKVGDKS